MASETPEVSFDSIIKTGRDRKRAQELASSIFSKGKENRNVPKSKTLGSPSLASRITKPAQRSSSSSSVNRTRVESAYNKANKTNGSAGGQGFSIRGAAGPYVVVGSNFAPGTSAADIRSAMEQVAGEMMSCAIITSNPTVIAEMVFVEKAAAEMVVDTFNNQRADGRLLHLYFKNGPPTRLDQLPANQPKKEPESARHAAKEQSDLFADKLATKGPRSSNVAEPEYHDGRYGFGTEDQEMEVEAAPENSRQEYRDQPGFEERRPERREYRQDYARGSSSRYGSYQPRNDRRPQQSDRLYSDGMYSSRSRQNGYSR